MNITIIYIFALFVIFTPKFILKVSHKYSSLIYSLLFTVVFYLTYDMVVYKEIEGALLTTYDVYGNQDKVNATNVNLGDVVLDNGKTSLNKPAAIIYTEPSFSISENQLEASPASSDYMFVNRFKLEQDLNNLFKHDHDDPYKQNTKEVLCAADYEKKKACCGQPPAIVPAENVCSQEKPYCRGYVALEKWGKCVKHNPDAPPEFTHKPEGIDSCMNKNERCSLMTRCCPGGPGSNDDVACKTEDCPVDGKPCVGSWMKENCPYTCRLCNKKNEWDGDISGYYIDEKAIQNSSYNLKSYVTIDKGENSKGEKSFIWHNREGSNWILERFSNTESFTVSNYPNNDWNMTRVILGDNNKITGILGPNNEIYTKQYYVPKKEMVKKPPKLGNIFKKFF
jgi:hypothetical protein